jgi:8-oxo-dGTP diphosphatase
MGIVRVVCGIIFKDNRVFICRRSPEKSLGGYWEFPGGKIEQGESNEAALTRELTEELGMKVDVKDYFKSNFHTYEKFTIELVAYKCNLIDANFQLKDHDSFEWVLIKDLSNWNLAPADIPIAKELIIKDNEE